jgi:hypothetical protein
MPPSSSATVSPTSTGGTTAAEGALAIAAAQAYLTELNTAQVSRSTTALRALFVPGCIVCDQDTARIDDWRVSGRTLVGGSLSYAEVRVEAWYDATNLLLVGQMTTTPATLKDASGKVVDRFDGGVGQKRMLMVKLSGIWLVKGFAS